MQFYLSSFCAILFFCLIHYASSKVSLLQYFAKSRFLSFGSGIALSYVFIDLLPKLGQSDLYVQNALRGIIPYMEHHVFVAALCGFMLFYAVDKAPERGKRNCKFYFSIVSYALFNFFIGYSVSDPFDPEVQPLVLFCLAIGLHYFTNDFTLNESFGELYRKNGKTVLLASILLGYTVGLFFELSKTAVALLGAFIGGGVIMNVIRHELPKEKPNSFCTFVCGAFMYTVLLLSLHQ